MISMNFPFFLMFQESETGGVGDDVSDLGDIYIKEEGRSRYGTRIVSTAKTLTEEAKRSSYESEFGSEEAPSA